MKLVLFDIDGTLITTHGAGMRAFYRAMDHLFHVEIDAEAIHPDGKTDPLILRELLDHLEFEDRWQEETRDAIFASYLGYLEEEMGRARELGQIHILPGVIDLLETLSVHKDFCLGLVTGNLKQGAQIKLKNAGLDKYFQFGGYGSDSEDRTTLTRIGIQRGVHLMSPVPVRGAFVIGDTPLDISHGHSAGALVIAVASARYDLDALREHGPDLLVPDLTQADVIISFMRDMPEGTRT